MSVMADTATPEFYQEQQQTTQELVDNGVSEIKLVKIEWGQISVNGTTATATAWETWSTTYSDGTTDQSRDRNVYTLVNDNGTWKVSADAHPDENPGGGPVPGIPNPNPNPGQPAPGQPNPGNPNPGNPRPRSRDTSQNWAGYAATGGTFTAVSGTWTVPQFTPDSQPGADATWVGIGGVNSRDLIQAGTQQTVSGSGTTQYETWVETLPQASHPVPLTISPGDSITISIAQQQTPDQWTIDFKNNTTGQTYSANEHYTSTLSSAEWIEESPSSMRGRQLPLDNFGTVSFSAGTAVKDGQQVSIADAGAKPITMITRGGQPLAQPSALDADGSSFSVARTATSSTSVGQSPFPGFGVGGSGRGRGRSSDPTTNSQ
jgi:hypothetical protein